MNRFIKAEHLPEKVILTDDPQRVRLMGSRQLTDVKTLFELRGMFGYSGTYQGEAVAVIACSFGESAARLYAEEAIRLGARELIYLGECVSRSKEIALLDVILARGGDPDYAEKIKRVAVELVPELKWEDTLTHDTFWSTDDELPETKARVIDFAARGIYRAASQPGIRAGVILTVAENTATAVRVVESVRQSRFKEGADLALEVMAAGDQ